MIKLNLKCTNMLQSTNIRKIKNLKENGFSKLEINKIVNSLKKINQLVIKNSKKNRKMINQLQIKQNQIIKSKMYYIDKIHYN